MKKESNETGEIYIQIQWGSIKFLFKIWQFFRNVRKMDILTEKLYIYEFFP